MQKCSRHFRVRAPYLKKTDLHGGPFFLRHVYVTSTLFRALFRTGTPFCHCPASGMTATISELPLNSSPSARFSELISSVSGHPGLDQAITLSVIDIEPADYSLSGPAPFYPIVRNGFFKIIANDLF